MYFVYILKSSVSNKTYTGYTENLVKRIREHNSGQTTYTKRFKPWKIVYTEELRSRLEAIQREKYLKSSAGRRFIKKEIFTI